MNKQFTPEQIHDAVQEHYGKIASQIQGECSCGCTDPSQGENQISLLYEGSDANALPTEVTDMSLGCGDPITIASLKPGQSVLDLGSGGGIDCFLAAKKVGPEGRVIGVDMTPAMIDKANSNRILVGAENVEFRLGQIENLPVESDSVDVIISNCVINLSPDKPAVFQEAFRVLKAGGKLAFSDIVTDGDLPAQIKENLSAWAGCVAGSWDIKDYVQAIETAGFVNVDYEATYWDEDFFNAAFEQLDADLQKQVLENKKNGKVSMVINSGSGMKVFESSDPDFEPRKAIFSARITARKPG